MRELGTERALGEARDALEALIALDAELDRRGVVRRTLDPERERASSFERIGRVLLPRTAHLAEGSARALAEGLCALARAVVAHFPENLLWDLDHLSASIVREACDAPEEAPRRLAASFEEAVALHALFGRGTPIRFRYVHDLVYGFDWAKWVRRDPASRRRVGPFDLAFLRSMRARGGELLALIEEDDPTYPRLAGRGARNPFVFSREPDAELALHRDLARRGLVPVRAWTFDDAPVWDLAFSEERANRARALGLTG